jgi:hypothetical protein
MNSESFVNQMSNLLARQVRDRLDEGVSVRFECDPANALTSQTIVIRAHLKAPLAKAGFKPIANCTEVPEFVKPLKRKPALDKRETSHFESKFPAKQLGAGTFHLTLAPALRANPIAVCSLRILTKSKVAGIRRKLIRALHGHPLEPAKAKSRRRPASKPIARNSSSRKRR